jgi:glycosyltransferase involved in cell wall biosynthesis
MRIIQAHNFRRQGGGDAVVFERTCALLRANGHEVLALTRDSRKVALTPRGKLGLAAGSLWSPGAARELEAAVQEFRPDVLHAHNLYPLLSPSILSRARRRGVPVILHCHNFRLTCPTELHLRRGQACFKCRAGGVWWSLVHRCRGGWLESGAYALQNAAARLGGIGNGLVDLHLAPSSFMRDWLEKSGIPSRKLALLFNPVFPPEIPADPSTGAYAAFVGRFSPEKGPETLLAAAGRTGIPVHIAGWVPPGTVLGPRVVDRGFLRGKKLDRFLRGARFLVVPSIWGEPFGLAAAEAMSYGLPVIASRTGALSEVVEAGLTGLLFSPGDADELADRMVYLWRRPELGARLGAAGRDKAVREYGPEAYYQGLMQIYARARES